MTISARVIADSTHSGGLHRLTTFVLRYPRFIHAELMTYRVLSRNAASSRAIPVQKMIQAVMDDPAMPVWWGKNQPGMQAREELSDKPVYAPGSGVDPGDRARAKATWLAARDEAVEYVQQLMQIGLHKQISNRILEPWAHIEVVCTGTDWANLYAQRRHPDAQPEFQELANKMFEAHAASTPKELRPGQWHLPFMRPEDFLPEWGEPGRWQYNLNAQRVSAARCARVSYLRHDGTPAPIEEDLELFNRLMGGDIKHASPTEHQARVPNEGDYWPDDECGDGELKGYLRSNLYGWVSFRKLIAGENVSSYQGFTR